MQLEKISRRWLSPAVETFELNPAFFPEATKTLFSKEAILQHGMVALGFKTVSRFFRAEKKLNVGFVDPLSKLDQEAARLAIEGKFESQAEMNIQPYEVQAAQLLAVLEKVFQITPAQILALKSEEVHPDLLAAAKAIIAQ